MIWMGDQGCKTIGSGGDLWQMVLNILVLMVFKLEYISLIS